MSAQLVLENVGVRLPNRCLFEQVNWTLYEGMRVALAGRNGSGKSTLLRILSGRTDSSEGKRTVVGGKKLRLGFLDQTVLENALVEIGQMKERALTPVKFIEHRLLSTHGEDHERSEAEIEWETRKILSGLGFSQEWMEWPISRLSGGWLLRMFIAATLLEKPEVLLLDEPTNHLDISSIQWLEEFLRDEYEGSLVLVTHDVALQKRTTDSLAILHGGRFYFRTHQQDYLTFRDSLGEETRQVEKAIETLDRKIEENMEFVYKFRAKAQTAARAQSKLKAAEDLTAEKNELKDRLERLRGIAYNLHFSFRLSGIGGKFPLSLKNLSFRYAESAPWILKDVTFDVKRGQTIAILGDNGAGKTTLLNVLASRLQPTSGEVGQGHALQMGYFGQHQLEELSLEDTVLDNLRVRATGVGLEQLRGWLGAFGFGGQDEVAKKAKVLSGGEKARLALLRILVTPVNVILLDEPTNHLDIETKDLLKKAIKTFEGTTILVSHDRDFVADVAERILYITHDHQLVDHIGSLDSFFEKYPEYVRHLEGRAKPSQAPKSAPTTPSTEQAAAAPQISYEERKKLKNQARSLEKKIAAAEADIASLGSEKEKLAASATSPEDFNKVSALEAALSAKMVDWEKMSTELDAIKKRVPGI